MYKTYKERSTFVGRGKLSRFRRVSDDFNDLSIIGRTVLTGTFERLQKHLTVSFTFVLQMKLCFSLLVVGLATVAATPCPFNSMCTCKTDEALRMHIACVEVPLYTIPGNY